MLKKIDFSIYDKLATSVLPPRKEVVKQSEKKPEKKPKPSYSQLLKMASKNKVDGLISTNDALHSTRTSHKVTTRTPLNVNGHSTRTPQKVNGTRPASVKPSDIKNAYSMPSSKIISLKTRNPKEKLFVACKNKHLRDLTTIEELQDEMDARRRLKNKPQESSPAVKRPPSRNLQAVPVLVKKPVDSPQPAQKRKLDIDSALQDHDYVQKNYSSLIQDMFGRRPTSSHMDDYDSSDMEVGYSQLRKEEAKRYFYVMQCSSRQARR
jgi:hypothetical protein